MIIGHKDQLKKLRLAVSQDRLANAYLFIGPDGIGKKLVAVEFAKGLFCNNGIADCNCSSCQRIEHKTHPDVLFVSVEEDKKDISIEQMREMQSKVQMHSFEGKYKVIIVDDAEKMNAASSNSILKILEEPPKATHFILITSRPHMLLPTIVSRCQRIQFTLPPSDEMISFICKKRGCDETTAKLLSKITCGSLGQAVDFPIEVMNEALENIKRLWSSPSPSEIISTAERWGKGENPSAILSTLIAVYNDILIYQTTKKEPSFSTSSKEIKILAENRSYSSIQNHIQHLLQAQQEIEATYNKQLMFEDLLFRL